MPGYRFSIDRGGTFTDVYAVCPNGEIRVMKLLSVDPGHYHDAPLEAIRRIMHEDPGISAPISETVETKSIDFVRMGTTVATNALLERKGEQCALAITKGFKDLLIIGNQSRPDIFDLKVQTPGVLYSEVVEIDERVMLKQSSCQLDIDQMEEKNAVNNEKVLIHTSLDFAASRDKFFHLFNKGFRSLAIVLLHSYLYPDHEQTLAKLAKEIGFTNVSLSHDVMPMIKIVPRAFTTTVDAYLTPCIRAYVDSFTNGFDADVSNLKVLFMQSDGGLSPTHSFVGSRAVLSGPAGGVIGYALTSYNKETGRPIVGFDMGGTSTDVSRYGGELEHMFETEMAGVTIQAPQLNIKTVAAGGGSCLMFTGGTYRVGPRSAGAYPGPVSYGHNGGELTITDANLILNRLVPKHFPSIFGPNRDSPLDVNGARAAFEQLVDQINTYSMQQDAAQIPASIEEVALGFVRVANETMCRAIRMLTQGKGYDTAKHALACFGGAGGQHACAIARLLGMSTVHIHRYAGILSAYGLSLADVVREEQSPCQLTYDQANFTALDMLIDRLVNVSTERMIKEGFDKSDIACEVFLHMRYQGTDGALMCQACDDNLTDPKLTTAHGNFRQSFIRRYQREFGFTLSGREIVVDDVRVRVRGMSEPEPHREIERVNIGNETPTPVEVIHTFFEDGFLDTEIHILDQLLAGHRVVGPAILISPHSTVLVEPNCVATITSTGDVEIEIIAPPEDSHQLGTKLDLVQLSIFSHRFMSIAEQMGRILQRTAISTNIKERLDFSCALFDSDGNLVANAPHIPVHLGAMQHAVQYQIQITGNRFKPGEVLLSNHPCAGGSHLPDLTVITPVFVQNSESVAFFVANRGHHADIGGSTPGSMPPHSTSIFEEGAVFTNFYLVRDGCFQEDAVIAALMSPAAHTGCSGSDNLSDLKAQVSANQRGAELLENLIQEYSLPVVHAYMRHIQDNAETAVRHMLRNSCLTALAYDEMSDQHPRARIEHLQTNHTLSAVDYMDDGTPICLKVTVDPTLGTAHFDFTGTGNQVFGNTNAPHAVLLSCLFYTLRCLVGGDICLNHGCLKPIQLTVPEGSILSASMDAAVVGGNVLTSQRIVDVILAAFKACAASQGCMNNVTFGTDQMGYYETVAGGAGAGPGWHGRSGIHTHMTNTRITDPEILEQRYPVLLQEFSFRQGSGGRGRWTGGNGLTRSLLFRSPVTLSILSERRALPPYGLFGGEAGLRGLNLLHRKNMSKPVNLGGKASVQLHPGDRFILHTPGGGGFGSYDSSQLP